MDLQLRSDAFSGVYHFLTAHRVPSVNIGIFFASKSESFNVNVVAEEFLTETQYVSGDLITPKCHYSVHYTRLMETYRPVNVA